MISCKNMQLVLEDMHGFSENMHYSNERCMISEKICMVSANICMSSGKYACFLENMHERMHKYCKWCLKQHKIIKTSVRKGSITTNLKQL